MTLAQALAAVAVACVFWNVIASILIATELDRRWYARINYVFLKVLIPFYAHRYKRLTLQKTGRVGPLFYHWLISIIAALLFGIAAILALKL